MSIHDTEIEDQLQLGQFDNGRPTTEEEFAGAFYEEPWKYERVGGRLVVLPPERTDQVIMSAPWRDRLGAYSLNLSEIVQAVVSNAWLAIDEDNSRIGDIGVYLGGSLESLDVPHQVPDLMFEFVTPSKAGRRRDYVEKRADYQKVGVREYVIVDRHDRKVTVLTLGEQGYQERVLTADDLYESPLLPGFSVRLSEVFSR